MTQTETGAPTIPPRRIALEPHDWHWAHWRPRVVLPEPAPRPFDAEVVIAAAKQRFPDRAYEDPRSLVPIPPRMQEPEAWYWLRRLGQKSPKKVPTDMKRWTRPLHHEEVPEHLRQLEVQRPELVAILASLFPPLETCLLLGNCQRTPGLGVAAGLDVELAEGLRRYLLVYLSDTEVRELRDAYTDHTQRRLAQAKEQVRLLLPEVGIAATLGCREIIDACTDALASYRRVEWLPDAARLIGPTLLLASYDRQRVFEGFPPIYWSVGLDAPLRGWLAHTEFDGVEWLGQRLLELGGYVGPSNTPLDLMLRVEGPEAVPYLCQAAKSREAAEPVRRWFAAHPEHGAAGLVHVAAGRGKIAEKAVSQLQELVRRGYGFATEEALAEVEAKSAVICKRLRQQLSLATSVVEAEPWPDDELPAAVAGVIATGKNRRTSDGWEPEAFPRLVLQGRPLSVPAMGLVLGVLKNKDADQIASLRMLFERDSLDDFVEKLLERWAAPEFRFLSKHAWVGVAIAVLAGKGTVRRLGRIAGLGRGKVDRKAAARALDLLFEIGSDDALATLARVPARTSLGKLCQKATELLHQAARRRLVLQATFEDRYFANCDLDRSGERVFDYGPRRFTVRLHPDGSPVILDESGKVRSSMPKPGKQDDPPKAAAAYEDWRDFRTELRETLTDAALWLARAMVDGRRWSPVAMRRYILASPIRRVVARTLVWAVYGANDERLGAFVFEPNEGAGTELRLDEVRSLDGDVALSDGRTLGVLHPAEIDRATRRRWIRELRPLLEQSFEMGQLYRAVYRPAAEDGGARHVASVEGAYAAGQQFRQSLQRGGWLPVGSGSSPDFTRGTQFMRPFPASLVTAILELGPAANVHEWNWQLAVRRLGFVPGVPDDDFPGALMWLPIRSVEPVAFSEALQPIVDIAIPHRVVEE